MHGTNQESQKSISRDPKQKNILIGLTLLFKILLRAKDFEMEHCRFENSFPLLQLLAAFLCFDGMRNGLAQCVPKLRRITGFQRSDHLVKQHTFKICGPDNLWCHKTAIKAKGQKIDKPDEPKA